MFTQSSDGGDTDRGPATLYDYSLAREQNKVLEGEDVENIDSDMRNYRYKLLFGGEVVGFEWVKTPSNRSIVLQCQDWSNYWDYALQFKNTDLFGPGYKAMFSGGSTNLFTDFLETPSEVIIRLINQKSVQYPKLEGLLGGLIHLLEAIGGSLLHDERQDLRGAEHLFLHCRASASHHADAHGLR
jgi:hypothetical protein